MLRTEENKPINTLKIFADSKTFAIVTHQKPDVDAVASSLAMYWYLLDIGKKENDIDVIIPEYTDELSFIPGTEHLKKQPTKKYDLAIIVDCPEKRFIAGKKVLKLSKKTICFGHHGLSRIYTHNSIINTCMSSCASVIYDVFPECRDINYFNCIAIGLIADTSNLTLDVTDKEKQIIEILKNKGVDIEEISKKLIIKK